MKTAIEFPTLDLEDKSKQKEILSLLSCLVITPEIQQRFENVFLDEMRLGMSKPPKKESSLLMENTFVRKLTNGTEKGDFLALDLGGTNFRVIWIQMKEGKIVENIIDHFEVPEQVRHGPGKDLFDFLANCISNFMQKNDLHGQKYKLGFTFSFPMYQRGLRVGVLTSWTKSFMCSNVVGEDAVALLESSMKARGDLDNVTITAVLNDTTGTLIKGSYLDRRCAIGMILGTGCNACYIEKTAKFPKWGGDPEGDEVIVDIEWGSFGDNGVLDFMRTQWDDRVDEQSLLKKSFTFEKYFAGKYLGDLIRETLLTLFKKGLLGNGKESSLNKHGALKTSSITAIEKDTFSNSTSNTEEIIINLGLECNEEVVKTVKYVSALLSYRGIHLVSILTALLINHMNRPHCTVAIDGSLFRLHPRFKILMEHLISQYAPQKPFSLLLAQDGSGKGAALLAAVEDRLVNGNHH